MRMRATLLAVAVVLGAGTPGAAQCPFPHPAKASGYRASLVQAFVACRTSSDSCCSVANAETESGVPSCYPAETFAENGGSQSGSWVWGRAAKGSVAIVPKGSDVAIAVTLSGVLDQGGAAEGQGSISVVLRATLADPAVGAMTTVDFPLSYELPVHDGRAKLKTTLYSSPLAAHLSAPCVSFEIIAPPTVHDPNTSPFASAGLYLP